VSRVVFVDPGNTASFPYRRERCSDHRDWPLTRQPGLPCCQSNNTSVTMSHTGTMRGTPKPNRNQAAAAAQFNNSPSSIPRPALDSHASHVAQSDVGGSTLSASRAKMSKRDEVGFVSESLKFPCLLVNRPSDGRLRPT
jgi:hypothetical protein